MIASNNSNPTAFLACRHEIYYDIHRPHTHVCLKQLKPHSLPCMQA
jgi:hypothetical protein